MDIRRWAVWMAGLALGASASGQVAISEFLNDPDGNDQGREWLELFNYGGETVDLDGWSLGDEGSDLIVLPPAEVPPGGYLILVSGGIGGLDAATAKAVFETEWLGGAPDPRVVGVTGVALANGADELVLHDPGGSLVWSLAHSDDDTPAHATFLTETHDFSVSVFGDASDPGVVRDGFDNGIDGFLGYQSNDATPDDFASTSDISQLAQLYGKDFDNVQTPSVASPLAGGYRAPNGADLDGDGIVGTEDLLILLAAWGPCPDPCPPVCPPDLDGDCQVSTADLLQLLGAWGEA
jgi:hypothetical protein